MESMSVGFNKFYQKLRFKTNEDGFYKALKIIVSVFLAYVLFYHKMGASFTMGLILGICFCSSSDISSNLKEKILGVGFAAITVPLLSVILTFLYPHIYMFFIVFGLLFFLASFISLYGQRANQLSFTLLLGMCLSFVHITDKSAALDNGLHMFYGGVLYLLVSILFFLVRPTKYISLQLATYIDNVSQYFSLSKEFWENNANADSIQEKQLALQVTINGSLQTIKQYLDVNKSRIINSESNRKVIIATSFLNQIIDTEFSSTFKTKEVYDFINNDDHIKQSIQEIIEGFAVNLSTLANSLRFKTTYQPPVDLLAKYARIQDLLQKNTQLNSENEFYLKSVLDYLDNQIRKIKSLEKIYTEKSSIANLKLNDADFQSILSPNPYRIKTLIDNLNIKSTYFRFSLRFAIAVMLGLAIGTIFSLRKEYWILLTIVVIMRPGYGLTKNRMYQRIIGTLIGGIIGIVVIYFVTNTVALSILLLISMLLGFWFTSSDYKVGVAFITLYIVFMYGILKEDVDVSIFYRITDTLIGAFIAFLATNFLWPSWELNSIKKIVIQALSASNEYVKGFKKSYFNMQVDETDLQNVRQEAYIEMGNLMASYQRLVQEPKGKQQNRANFYEIAILNQSLIGAVSSLGSFIRLHQDNEDIKQYDKIVNTISFNLLSSLNCFDKTILKDNNQEIYSSSDLIKLQVAQKEQIEACVTADFDKIESLKESQLALSQLSWILNLSEQVLHTSTNIENNTQFSQNQL